MNQLRPGSRRNSVCPLTWHSLSWQWRKLGQGGFTYALYYASIDLMNSRVSTGIMNILFRCVVKREHDNLTRPLFMSTSPRAEALTPPEWHVYVI